MQMPEFTLHNTPLRTHIAQQEYPSEIIPVASYFTSNGISDCSILFFKPENPLKGCFKFFQLYLFLRESAFLYSHVWSLNSLLMSFTFWTRSQKGMHQSKKARRKNLAIKWT